ncbi:MAG TPA: oxygenase MpaB family protein [Arachnia sp.]|nr:oxygenase MpaB family protein [Arachnia sp.]
MANPVEWLRGLIGAAIRERVAGPDEEARVARIWGAVGERWHAPTDAIWKVNRDAAMYAGGIRALLLQALHPAAMAGVAGHSGYRSDPWGRLQRTGEFIAMTTYGPIPSAEELIARIRAVHERVRGKTDDGTPYRASDPHLLAWVHAAETQSFLAAYQHFGPERLTAEEADQYVASAAPVGELLGAVDLPRTEAELAEMIDGYRPELRASAAAIDTVEFLLKTPPVPWPGRLGYWMLAAGAIATLPVWAREPLGLPTSRWFDRLVGLPLGGLATRVAGWAIATPKTAAEQAGA